MTLQVLIDGVELFPAPVVFSSPLTLHKVAFASAFSTTAELPEGTRIDLVVDDAPVETIQGLTMCLIGEFPP